MLEAYAVNQTIDATTGLVPFTTVALVKGETAVLSGSTSIQLNRCGVYHVEAVVSGTPANNGAVTLTMTKNGVTQPQATVNNPNGLTTVSVDMPITTLVQVTENNGPCCCKAPTVLQFVNTGVALNNASTSVVVTKLC